jgi:hypothetical protein
LWIWRCLLHLWNIKLRKICWFWLTRVIFFFPLVKTLITLGKLTFVQSVWSGRAANDRTSALWPQRWVCDLIYFTHRASCTLGKYSTTELHPQPWCRVFLSVNPRGMV